MGGYAYSEIAQCEAAVYQARTAGRTGMSASPRQVKRPGDG